MPKSRSPSRSGWKKYKLKAIKPSTKKTAKKMAIFEHKTTGRTKTVHFGARGMSDYTIHKDKERMKRYLSRHRARENWNNPMSAGALSRWILWNKPSYSSSVADYKRRFWNKN